MIDFLCIGAQKSGTTLLYEQLKTINEIYMPDTKELHFFDNSEHYHRGEAFYLKHFEDAAFKQLKGEVTPAYLFIEEAPMRIKEFVREKSVKFIVLLRNPVDRAYSQYQMVSTIQKKEILSFEQALIYENFRLKEHRDIINFSYIRRGFYAKQVLNYFKYFNKEQFLFVMYENFVDNQVLYMNKILSFLGLSKHFDIENKMVFNHEYEEMKPEIRTILYQIYKEDINILENILDIDLSVWKEKQ